MTDCYTCGRCQYPILEGQNREFDPVWGECHANPADHLLTLIDVPEGKTTYRQLWNEMVQEERQRTARLLENMPSPFVTGSMGANLANFNDWRKEAVRRIRSGE